MKVYVKELNMCPMRKVNIFQYIEALKLNGDIITDSIDEADKVLVWTCAVRGDFHDNGIDVVKKFEIEGRHVVLAGCLPSINPEFAKSFYGQIIHFNNDDKEFYDVFGATLEEADYPIAEAPITVPLDQYRKEHPGVKVVNDDQYIKLFISEGCTRQCSYCTEILAFPPYQSYKFDKIVNKAHELVSRTGIKKIALFGDDIGAYGVDNGTSLIKLIKALTSLDTEIQISLKQINPIAWLKYFNEIQELIYNNKIFQILAPIQSANNRILKLMKRGYTSEDIEFLFSSLRNLKTEVELETHIIAGFPTETAEEWNETVDFICKHHVRYVMGNVFMPGKGTEAEKMWGQIPEEEKEIRMLSGAAEIEKYGTVISHNFSWRAKEHMTHTKINFIEL